MHLHAVTDFTNSCSVSTCASQIGVVLCCLSIWCHITSSLSKCDDKTFDVPVCVICVTEGIVDMLNQSTDRPSLQVSFMAVGFFDTMLAFLHKITVCITVLIDCCITHSTTNVAIVQCIYLGEF